VKEKSILATKAYQKTGGQTPTFECFPTNRRKLFLYPKLDPPAPK